MLLKFNPSLRVIQETIDEYQALLKNETDTKKIKRYQFEIEQLEALKQTMKFEQDNK